MFQSSSFVDNIILKEGSRGREVGKAICHRKQQRKREREGRIIF